MGSAVCIAVPDTAGTLLADNAGGSVFDFNGWPG
jgi:hypothetical protein